MEVKRVTTTNLLLLRKILEGEADNISDCSINAMNGLDLNNSNVKNSFKYKKKCKMNKNQDFYLSSDDAFIKTWLKQKKEIIQQKRKQMTRQKKEEKMKNQILCKEKEERLGRARESYDKWLKENRKRHMNNTTTPQSIPSDNTERIIRSEESYKAWLDEKNHLVRHNKKDNARHSKSQLIRRKEFKLEGDSGNVSNSKVKRHRTSYRVRIDKLTKETESETIDESLLKIILNLQNVKLKEKQLSKRRVDSGLFFHRAKSTNKVLPVKTDDGFQWIFDIEEKGSDKGKFKTMPATDRQASRVDKISCDHENPFVEKPVEKATI